MTTPTPQSWARSSSASPAERCARNRGWQCSGKVSQRPPCRLFPVKLRLLAACAWLLLFPATACAQQALDAARAHYERALQAAQSRNYQAAADDWTQALKLFLTLPDTERQQADAHKNLGTVLQQLGRGAEAMAQTQQALKLYQILPGTERQQARCHQNLGEALDGLDKYAEAQEHQLEALKLYRIVPGTEHEQAACYGTLGLELKKLGKYEEALPQHQRALELFQTLPGTAGAQADCHNNLGGALSGLNKRAEALVQFQQALKLYQTRPGTERDQARCHQNIGEVLRNLEKYDEAIGQHQQALKLLQDLPDAERDRADCYQNLGVALSSIGHFEEALTQHQQALRIYQTFPGSERDQADCYQNLGVALGSLGQQAEALAQHQQALTRYRKIQGTDREQARCHQNLGVALDSLDQHAEALAQHQHALELYQTAQGAAREQADCYNNLGTALRSMGQYEEALAQTWQALKLYQTCPDTTRQQAGCYGNLGTMLRDLGQYAEALGQLQQTLKLFQDLPATEGEQAGCYQNLGGTLYSLGQYDAAQAQTRRALKLYQTLQGTVREQARCRQNLGRALDRLGQYAEALAQHQQALKLFQTVPGTERDQLACWGNIGHCLLGTGRCSDAIAAFNQAGKTVGVSLGLSQAYRRRGQPGDIAQALTRLLRASELAEAARVGMLAREHREGIFEQVAEVFPELTGLLAEQGGKRVVLEEAAAVRWARDPESASAGLEAAFHFADQGKGRSLNDALRERSTLKAARADTRLLAEDKELSQRISKLTTMREALPGAQTERKTTLTRDLEGLQQRRNMLEVELKKTLLGAYVAQEFRKPMETAAELAPGTAVLQYSVGEKESWLLLLTREGVTAHKLGCDTPALPELRPRQQATVGQLVEAWRQRPDKIGLDGLVQLARERAADQGREVKRNLVDATQEQAILQRLGGNVLPASALVALRQRQIQHLLVIPDGALHYVPFAMLRVAAEGGATPRYLLEEFSVSYTPAMATLETVRKQKKARELKRKRERHQLLAFANPAYGSDGVPVLPATLAGDDLVTRVRSLRRDYYAGSGLRLSSLPETEQEALRVAALFGLPREASDATGVDPDAMCLVLKAKAASEEQAKRLLGPQAAARYRYLLFSTHGLADPQNGMLSCIALSAPTADSTEDGFLQAQEVLDLDLDTDLVMLSACQTGLGRLRGGEGLVGLSGAFFVAGAESISASLWDVPSGPTGQLVTEFFKQLQAGAVDRAQALRLAQLTVMRHGQSMDGKPADYCSPFCWAAFVLLGEYRASGDMR